MADSKKVLRSKADILNGNSDLHREPLFVEAWNMTVYVREFTSDEIERLRIIQSDSTQNRQLLAKMAALVIVDDAGERIFTDKDAEDLNRRSYRAISLIVTKANELSGLTPPARDDLGKGSAATGSAASSSVSA